MQPDDLARLLMIKAGQDEAVVDRLIDDEAIGDEAIGFHLQQAAEKLLKAWLAGHAADIRKTHNLVFLMDQVVASGGGLPEHFRDVDVLIPFAVDLRYDVLAPDVVLDRHGTRDLVARLRLWVEQSLNESKET